MSLTALSASAIRPASFLPAIKCSDCGVEIEIARMGEHICRPTSSAADPAPASMHNPFALRQMNANGQQLPPLPPPPPHETTYTPPLHQLSRPFSPSPLQKSQQPPSRTTTRGRSTTVGSTSSNAQPPFSRLPPPPRINPDAANKSLLAPSFPRSASPASPALSYRSARSGSSSGSRPPMLRNQASSSLRGRERSPSPDLPSSFDCAFPPFPVAATGGSRPSTSNGRKTPTGSDRAPSRGASRTEGRYGDRDTYGLEPRSPGLQGDDGVRRGNTSRNGPADAGGRNGAGPPEIPLPPLPTKFASNGRSSPLAAHDVDEPMMALPSIFSPSAPPIPLRSSDRSRTFPSPTDNPNEADHAHSLSRAPSEPPPRSRDRRPTLTSGSRPPMPQQSRSEETPRPTSRAGPRIDHRMQDAPPVPNFAQQHLSSGSASSTSTDSQSYSNGNSSEGPSSVGSVASSVDTVSPISQASNPHEKEDGGALQNARPKSERMRSAGYSTKSQQQNPGLRAEQPAHRSPPPNFARPRPHVTSPVPSNAVPQSLGAVMEAPVDTVLDDRQMDVEQTESFWPQTQEQAMPAPLRLNRSTASESSTPVSATSQPDVAFPSFAAQSTAGEYDPFRPQIPTNATRSRSKSNASQYSTYFSGNPRSRSPPSVELPPLPPAVAASRPRPVQRRTTSAKPLCRGCDQVIEGKSVKAADGRLTGRWHKQCFTCRTCTQPFATADFYVIENQPYCKHHYHEKNGSLCHGCQRGIEGQYLETTSSSSKGGEDRKYHPHCFTCAECRIILSDDYFEIAERVYCERHAFQAMRSHARVIGGAARNGAGGLQPPDRREMMSGRRTTKLMMM